ADTKRLRWNGGRWSSLCLTPWAVSAEVPMNKRAHLCLAVVLGLAVSARSEDKLGDNERPTRAWVAALKEKDPRVRGQAASALGQMGAKARDAVSALTEALKDPDLAVRGRAAVALWKIDKPLKVILPVLLEARRGADDDLRAAAADVLGRVGP